MTVPVPYSALSHLDCARCRTCHDADRVQGTCSCGSPLLARYDLRQVAGQVSPRDIAGRPADLWRYHELLPVRQADRVVSFGEGMTPLLAMPKIGQALGVPDLLMKDEGLLPTGTFKARGAAVGISRAAELGVAAIAMPTNGNAGAAWSVYAARAGMASLIVMPAAAPQITRAECAAAGAELYLVDGGIEDAGRLVADVVARRPGYQNAATLREPYRIEGKKTMGLEIAEQLGWRMPDVIVYPAGGGVGIIGIYKALRELLELGWVTGDLPRLVAVQPDGCAPIVRAFQAGAAESEPWPDPRTVAFGLTVPKALGDFLVLDALYATGGTAVAVTDEALLAEQRAVARLEGSFICPEGSACFAALRQLRASGWLPETDQVVVLNTGTGLIYPDTMPADPRMLPLSGSIPVLSPDGRPSAERGLPAAFFLLVLTAGRRRLLGRLLRDPEPFFRRRAFACRFLGLSGTHSRFRTLSRAFLAVRLRMNAELVPIGLGKIDVVVTRGLLDICERLGAIGIGNVDHLIETCDRIPHVRSISQRLFALLGKRKDRVRQVASGGKVAVPFVRLPGCFCCCHGGASLRRLDSVVER
jgi:threonine synthase